MNTGVKIWVIARNSHQKRIRQIINSLERIKVKYSDIKIIIWSYINPGELALGIEHIKAQTDLLALWGKGILHNSIVLIDQIDRKDIYYVNQLVEKEIPLIIEEKILRKLENNLKRVQRKCLSYSYLHPGKLEVVIPKIIRDQGYCQTNYVNIRTDYSEESEIIRNEEFLSDIQFNWEGTSRADLVIINYNTLKYLKECIVSIKKNTQYPFNIIVVDNGSNDGSVQFLKRLKGITLITNQENQGYARACNQGIMVGEGEFVVILNSDIIVSPGWLTSMVNIAKSDKQIGVVGPKMVDERNKLVGAGVTKLNQFCSSRGTGLVDQVGLFDKTEDCYSVGGACYLINREALRKVGRFDESYFFYYEETDLSLRMLEKGYRVVYSPEARITHFQEGSMDVTRPQERSLRNHYFFESQQKFTKKWIEILNGATIREFTRDIVVFGIIPWDFRFQRPQQFCTRLAAQGYRILYINNTCTHQIGGSLKKINDNLYVASSTGNGVVYNNLGFHQQRELINSIYRFFDQLSISNPILWVDVPYWGDVIENFEREMLVYNCMDSYTDFTDLQKFCPNLEQKEEILSQSADLIITSALLLEEKMHKYNDNVVCVPNGVDLSHFAQVQIQEKPKDLIEIPQPIIGYYGAIAEWMDLELIKYIAEKMGDHSFVFIGQPTVNISELTSISNIYFLGEKPYHELPNYLYYFKTTIIPFKKNRLSLSTNPVKLYEYLAGGKPVVSVDLPEIRKFSNVVYIAENYDQFLFLLQQVGDDEIVIERNKRLQAVEGNDWDDRVKDILNIIETRRRELIQKNLFGDMQKMLAGEKGDQNE